MSTTPTGDAPEALWLIDGSALAYRSHFAMAGANMSAADGTLTGATFGFASELHRLAERVHPDFAAVVFDTSAPTFRHEIFSDYKATRERMPEELAEQLPLIKEICAALGWPLLEMDGYEADDIMGTLSRKASASGRSVYLVTGDKDFMQLVDERVVIYNIMKKGQEVVVVDEAGVREHFGVPPSKVVDVLGLMGDTSDNVPGVPGIGQKTAKKLIEKYGSVEALLEAPGTDLSPRIRKNLEEHAEMARLSKRLVTIDDDVPISVDDDTLRYEGPDREKAADLFQRLGFRTLGQTMREGTAGATDSEDGEETPPAPAGDYVMVATAEALDTLVKRLDAAELVAVDTETTSLNARHARIVGCSFSFEEGAAFYVPLALDPPLLPDAEDQGAAILDALRPFLEDVRPRKCGQNLKYDLLAFENHGIALSGIRTDSMIASYLVEPEERERNLDALALRHFGHTKIPTSAIIGKGKDAVTMDEVPPQKISPYACEDADFARRLSLRFLDALDDPERRKLHDDVEIPLIAVLARMERAGVRLDREQLGEMTEKLEERVHELVAAIHERAGRSFTINSPKQLGALLFEELKIHEELGYKPKRTKTGWATGQEILEALAAHPLPGLVLEYRGLTKLLSTYVKVLPTLVDSETGRIHAQFNQTVAATGRLSSSDPNLQNIPIRTEVGRKVRSAFVPADEHHVLLAADYSQIELRIMAHLSQDEALLGAFNAGHDIHAETASRIFGIPKEEVGPTERGKAKAVNFGILYGMGPQRLARENAMSFEEAKTFIKRYKEALPQVGAFVETLKERVRERGYAETLLGRRRPIPNIESKNRALQIAAENMAVNTPIQGTAADLLKIAMVRIDARIRDEGFRGRMILTVHDELVFDVPKDEVEHLRALVVEEMQGALELSVPLEVGVGVGSNWLEAH